MIKIGGKPLLTNDIEKIVLNQEQIGLNEATLQKVKANYEFLQDYAKDKIIYGINTGFGPMAQYRINEDEQYQLQLNLIRSHSSGAGNHFSETLSRATMLARLGSLIQGASGAHPETVELIVALLNKKISACIFEHGSVGASGDLVQLAHLALNLIGEGEVLFNGQLQSTEEVFKQNNIKPLAIHLREGLALLNGTSAMTGVGFVNLIHAKKAFQISLILSAITNEIMGSYGDHFSLELNQVKHHEGQSKVAEGMRSWLSDSKMIRHRADHLYKKVEEQIFTEKVQEYYSLRCVPQILGPIYDTLLYAEKVLVNEINSSNDNPVVDHVNQHVYHGGNFHGDYVSLEMDKMKIAIAKLSMLAERQLNYLLNDKLNQKLPSFVNLGKLGFNFGMQGIAFTATSTTAENQTLAFPMYLHSIPNNNDNQDIVSMGTNGALIARKVIDNSFEVLAIQATTLIQAIDYLKCHSKLGASSQNFYDSLRKIIPTFVEDQPKYKALKAVKEHLLNIDSSLIF